ncbi:hypothetical protein [Nocardia arthritidis]|uniref:hypothetical protein n=1 Tax=Nocardia arthritidis TaxID=228602 RepID=UPI00142E5E1B|nr:hypothetical protein [Nocardia arthritidis]
MPGHADGDRDGVDPSVVTTATEFVDALRRLRGWSGLTVRQLEKRAACQGDKLARSTLAAALSRDALPRNATARREAVRSASC